MQDDMRQLVATIERGWNTQDWGLMQTIHTEDWIERSSPPGLNDLATFERSFAAFCAGFPDFSMTISMTVVEGNTAAYLYRITGTNSGSYLGIPASGQAVDFEGMTFVRARDGKIAEAWGVVDQLKMLQQLGVLPAPGQPAAQT